MSDETNVGVTEAKSSKAPVKKELKASSVSQSGRKKAATAKVAQADASVTVAEVGVDKNKKSKKPKLVRDSFKFPQEEYAQIELLKNRCLEAGLEVKKSELVRAGLLALKSASDKKLISIVGKLEKLKTGRPAL